MTGEQLAHRSITTIRTVVAGQADRAQILQEAHIAQDGAVLIAIKSGEKMGSKLSIISMARGLNPHRYISALSYSPNGSDWLTHADGSEVTLVDQLVADTSVQDYLRYSAPMQPSRGLAAERRAVGNDHDGTSPVSCSVSDQYACLVNGTGPQPAPTGDAG